MKHSEARISGAYMRHFYLYFLANYSPSHIYVRARCPEYCELAPYVLKIAPECEFNGSTINETYDSVDDPACEWHFPSLAMPFEGGPEGRGRD